MLELVVVVAVLAILAAIAIPFFQSLIKQAAYVAGKWTLASAKTSCAANKTLPIPAGFVGTQFSSSKPSDVCSGVLTATHVDGCQLSIDLENGVRTSTAGSGWPETYEVCELGIQIADKPESPSQTPVDVITNPKGELFPKPTKIEREARGSSCLVEELNGNSICTIASTVEGNQGVMAIKSGDIDGDGDIDFVVANQTNEMDGNSSSIELYLNDGFQNFSGFIVKEGTSWDRGEHQDIELIDLDGDGDLDIVTADRFTNSITFLENDGGATSGFQESKIAEGIRGASDIYIDDIDGDGSLDIVTASPYDDTIILLKNSGEENPIFSQTVISASADWTSDIEIADINGDGKKDIIAAVTQANRNGKSPITYFANTGTNENPEFKEMPVSETANYPRTVKSIDIDGDGDQDLVTGGEGENSLIVHVNDGGIIPEFTEQKIESGINIVEDIEVFDYNGDGKFDIVATDPDSGKINIYTPDSSSSSGWRQDSTLDNNAIGAKALHIADLDGDGDLDIMSGNPGGSDGQSTDFLKWYKN